MGCRHHGLDGPVTGGCTGLVPWKPHLVCSARGRDSEARRPFLCPHSVPKTQWYVGFCIHWLLFALLAIRVWVLRRKTK